MSANEPRRFREALLWIWAGVATLTLLVLLLTPRYTSIPADWWASGWPFPKAPPDRLVLEPTSFDQLPGWTDDSVARALPALRRSCLRNRFLGPQREIRPAERGGTVADWNPLCDPLLALGEPSAVQVSAASSATSAAVRAILERETIPLAVMNRRHAEGLFTGYYEPTLRGSRARSARYRYPLYRPPGDIIGVDLGAFRDDLAGRRVAGYLDGSELKPYHDRKRIEAGALARRGLELAWVDDAVDSFFLHIQGSGRVELDEGGVLRVGYAGQNGHPYYAIGRELVIRDGMDPKDVSMQSIRAWLASHPEQAAEVMNSNASYVFFRELKGEGPVGSQGVALEPGRSLAVDRAYHPMGAPVWLDASAPAQQSDGDDVPLRRLVVAQDTGGAIKGPVRGDVFWGGGDAAAEVAGRMKHRGRMWVLYPRALAERILAQQELERRAELQKLGLEGGENAKGANEDAVSSSPSPGSSGS